MPHGIKEWLKEEARRNRRSLSAEVTYRLEESRRAQLQRERRKAKSQ
ncbi:Arc family DNA-binding protein [Halomonas daqingensis]|nr:Arc family DNA-binding protein [Halomonas desiderata]